MNFPPNNSTNQVVKDKPNKSPLIDLIKQRQIMEAFTKQIDFLGFLNVGWTLRSGGLEMREKDDLTEKSISVFSSS